MESSCPGREVSQVQGSRFSLIATRREINRWGWKRRDLSESNSIFNWRDIFLIHAMQDYYCYEHESRRVRSVLFQEDLLMVVTPRPSWTSLLLFGNKNYRRDDNLPNIEPLKFHRPTSCLTQTVSTTSVPNRKHGTYGCYLVLRFYKIDKKDWLG